MAWTTCMGAGLFVACQGGVPAAEVVARVDGAVVTKQALEAQVGQSLRRYGEQRQHLPASLVDRIRENALHTLIEHCLVAQRAEREDIVVTPQEVETQLAQHRARFQSQATYQDFLTRANQTEDNLRQDFGHNLLRDRVVDKVAGPLTISDGAIQRFYDDNEAHFVDPEQMRAHRILLRCEDSGAATRRRRRQAEELRARAYAHRQDPAAFEKLAKQHSEAPEASRGGALGLLLAGHLPELDRALVQGLDVGGISDVMEGPQGLSIFRLDAHQPRRRRPITEVQSSIRAALQVEARNERRGRVLRQLRAEAKVVTFLPAPPRPATVPTPAAPRSPSEAQQVGAPPAPRQEVGQRGGAAWPIPAAGRPA